MSQEPAGFTLPSGDFNTPPQKKRGMPVWLMILLGVVLLLVLGCGALVALGVGFVAEQNDPVAQTATAAAGQEQLRADEALIVDAELVIEEFFDSPDAIDITPGDGSEAEVVDGAYEATLSESSFRSVYLNEPLGDIASEVDCVTVAGGRDAGCGIIFGVNETSDPSDNDQHFFFVKGNQYGMQTTEGGSETSWSKSHGAVNGAEGSTNLLRVIRQGSDVRLYVNDVLVDRFELTSLPSGGVGFAASADENDAVVRIDNFRIWDLER